MALSGDGSTLVDELVAIIAKTPKNTVRFPKLKSSVENTLKQSNSRRIDQFEVARRLDGLQEKFQVLNNDPLADALHVRLEELKTKRKHIVPEVLFLLLQLSDRPATLSKVEDVELALPPDSPPTLTWSELDAADPFIEDENLWKDIDYSADTSDSEISTASSVVSIPRIIPQSSDTPADDYIPPDNLFIFVEDKKLVSSIQDAQFWRNDACDSGGAMKTHSLFLTELQAIKETIFMLQGLPTSLFWHLDDAIEVDRRFFLHHASNRSFGALLESFSAIGARIRYLRAFINIPQQVQFMQMFQHEAEGYLSAFDMYLSDAHTQYSIPRLFQTVSLLELLGAVRKECRLLLELADVIKKLGDHTPKEAIQCLDLLYNLVCFKQASGEDEEFKRVAKLFFNCFEIYTKPIRLWMETGQLDKTQGFFFVSDVRTSNDLRSLWNGWFSLEELSGRLFAPRFLSSSVGKIFTTGKSMIFLRNLGVALENLDAGRITAITYEDVCPPDSSSLLLPFSGLLGASFDRWIHTNHSIASGLLRKQLDEQGGLWLSLQALEYIYLGKDLSRSVAADRRIFELIDKRSQSWNDRFLLTELVQGAFSGVPCVDTTRLIARPARTCPQDFEIHCRSVKILKAIFIEYVLPWPVANIITKEVFLTYQRVYTFLMQIRRAKFVIERQRVLKFSHPHTHEDKKDDFIGYCTRHSLLWFLNVVYSHLTELVIAASTVNMQKSLAKAKDVDAMIAVHQSYALSLEGQCLLSKRLAPIYQAVISLLDLSIHFSDIQAMRHGEHRVNQTDPQPRSSTDRCYARHSPRRSRARAEDSDSTEEGPDTDDDTFDEGNATSISFLESPYVRRMMDLKAKFDRLYAFIIAGLRGVCRVDGQQSWEILADKLEWKRERFAQT